MNNELSHLHHVAQSAIKKLIIYEPKWVNEPFNMYNAKLAFFPFGFHL